MFLGAASFLAIGVIGYAVDKQTLIDGKWTTLIALYVVMGNGRAVFESTNRAVFVDFFPDTKAGAFAFLGVQSGIAGTIGFLVFTPFVKIDPTVAAEILVVLGAMALILVPCAFLLHSREKRDRENHEALLEEYRKSTTA